MDNNIKKRLVALCDSLKSYGYMDAVEEIESSFPEITENNDETIMREISDFLRNGIWLDAIVDEVRHSQKNINWAKCIEKQKEKNVVNIDQFKSLMLQYLQSAVNKKDDTEIEKDTDKWAKKLLDFVNKENIEWDKKDENIYYFISEYLKRLDRPTATSCLDWLNNRFKCFITSCNNLEKKIKPRYQHVSSMWSEEDEKIRKELIDGVRQIRCKNGITQEQMIAYLERQKYNRMKPIYDARESFESALEKAWNDYHNGYENVDKLEDDYVECAHAKGFREGYLFGIEKQKEVTPNAALEKIRKAIDNTEQLSERYKDEEENFHQYYGGKADGLKLALDYLEKQKEQKPEMIQWTGKNLKEVIDFTGKYPRFDEWFKSWEEYENYVHSHNNIFKLFCEDGSHYEVPVGSWIVKTPDGFNIPSHFKFVQKPAEWGDTDNIGWDEAFACVTRAEKSAKNEEELQNAVTAEKWLKEIKFKHYVHPAYLEKQKDKEWVLPEDFEEAVYKVANYISPFDNQEEFRKTSHRFAKQLLSLAKKELDKLTEWSDDFEENIRNLLHNKLVVRDKDGNTIAAVTIDDKTLNDIVSGIWFYVGKEALKYPKKELNVIEWSEEDERMLSRCIKSIETSKLFVNSDMFKVAKDKEIAWLKTTINAVKDAMKEQKPEFPKPHKGDDNNPYDMQVSEALEYAIKRGFGVPFNDGEVYVDVKHMTQTIGNIIRWADEHPKEQNLEDIEDETVRRYMKLDKFALANMLAERDKTNAEIIESIESIEEQSPEWSEEDRRMLSRCIKSIETSKQFADSDAFNLAKDKEIAWFKSLPERFNLQPKQEWSEEDSRILYNVIAFVGYAAGQRGVKDDDFKEANVWLNSLPKRFNLQSKQEWSEDDEKMLASFLHKVEVCDLLTNKENVWIVERLKSLRPQPKQEWRDGEKKVLDSIIDDYEKAAKSFCGYGGKIMFLKAIRDGEYDLSKQEWSEEDENMFKMILGDLEWERRNTTVDKDIRLYDEKIRWLKSLRPQPKQEWSDEDKRILKGIIGKIDHDQSYGVSKEEMLNFLRDLHPQTKQEIITVKPIEIQIDNPNIQKFPDVVIDTTTVGSNPNVVIDTTTVGTEWNETELNLLNILIEDFEAYNPTFELCGYPAKVFIDFLKNIRDKKNNFI